MTQILEPLLTFFMRFPNVNGETCNSFLHFRLKLFCHSCGIFEGMMASSSSASAAQSSGDGTQRKALITGITGQDVEKKRICCLLDRGVRCKRFAGEAGFTQRVGDMVTRSGYPLAPERTAGHICICDDHKAYILKLKPTPHAQPAYAQPAHAQSAQAQPAHAQPAHAQPTHAQPTHAQPAHAQQAIVATQRVVSSGAFPDISKPVTAGARSIPLVSGNQPRPPPLLSAIHPAATTGIIKQPSSSSNSIESSPSDSSQSIKSQLSRTSKFAMGKKPRDSLCIKRYEELRAPRPQAQDEEDEEDERDRSQEVLRSDGNSPGDGNSLGSCGGSQNTQFGSVEKNGADDDSGWGSYGVYREVSLPASQPISQTVTQPKSDKPLPPVQMASIPMEHGAIFKWDAVKFPSGLNEVSFEENLASHYRGRTVHPQPTTTLDVANSETKLSTVSSTLVDHAKMTEKTQVTFGVVAEVKTWVTIPPNETLATPPPAAVRTAMEQPPPAVSRMELELTEKLKTANELLQREKEQVLREKELVQREQELRTCAENKLQSLQTQLALKEKDRLDVIDLVERSNRAAAAAQEELRRLKDVQAENGHLKHEIMECREWSAAERRLSDVRYHTARDILQSVTASLSIFSRDMAKVDGDAGDAVEAVVQFAHTVRGKLDPIIAARQGAGSDDLLKVLRTETDELGRTVHDWKARMDSKATAAAKAAATGEIVQTRPNDTSTFGDDENAALRSATRSSLAPSSQQSNRTNPEIRAMWNDQTTYNQTMDMTSNREPPPARMFSDPPRLGGGGIAIFEDLSQSSSQPTVGPTDTDSGAFKPMAPIRQSLAPRKSVKQKQMQILPPQPLPFNIFVDASVYGQQTDYLPAIRPAVNDGVMFEKENEDDSENTPPFDAIQADLASKTSTRHVNGILNESVDHPVVPLDCLTDKDFFEVAESDSDGEADPRRQLFSLKPQLPPPRLSSQMIFAPAPQPLPRKSIPFNPRRSMGPLGDFQNEFNMTMQHDTGRKSMGGPLDQTLLVPQELDQELFFESIDPLQRMTSTPMVLGIAEDQDFKDHMRNRPRQSYLPPKSSACLSPITEGSRENKSSTPSSSGVSTWNRTKKSMGNYSPVAENDETGNKTSH
ncbi:hypothetical protein BV898_15404 [Hypsibius exemplaris]|uniref:Histone deacetylase complex subunit SAP30 zinc-finger domain-containing protein n=1 Tax=Hypsibius exemplaris TaxID=2072580 RepID=A0A9X6RKG3_HYPEX|nr:hypothetical protein BV898_15404 [Hypsibius exemplaris]